METARFLFGAMRAPVCAFRPILHIPGQTNTSQTPCAEIKGAMLGHEVQYCAAPYQAKPAMPS